MRSPQLNNAAKKSNLQSRRYFNNRKTLYISSGRRFSHFEQFTWSSSLNPKCPWQMQRSWDINAVGTTAAHPAGETNSSAATVCMGRPIPADGEHLVKFTKFRSHTLSPRLSKAMMSLSGIDSALKSKSRPWEQLRKRWIPSEAHQKQSHRPACRPSGCPDFARKRLIAKGKYFVAFCWPRWTKSASWGLTDIFWFKNQREGLNISCISISVNVAKCRQHFRGFELTCIMFWFTCSGCGFVVLWMSRKGYMSHVKVFLVGVSSFRTSPVQGHVRVMPECLE